MSKFMYYVGEWLTDGKLSKFSRNEIEALEDDVLEVEARIINFTKNLTKSEIKDIVRVFAEGGYDDLVEFEFYEE